MISIVIPARNEAPVIARNLRALTTGAAVDEIDVVVVCNACTDDTAGVARSFGPPVRVIETEVGGKAHALNLGDQPTSISSEAAALRGEILISTFLDRRGEKIKDTVDLRGNEGVIIGVLGAQPG